MPSCQRIKPFFFSFFSNNFFYITKLFFIIFIVSLNLVSFAVHAEGYHISTFENALKMEQMAISKNPLISYSDLDYLNVQKELSTIYPWEASWGLAQQKIKQIQLARRAFLQEKYKFSYSPKDLDKVSSLNYKPSKNDIDNAKAKYQNIDSNLNQNSNYNKEIYVSDSLKNKNKAKIEQPSVILYSASWCGYCRRAREFLQSKKIPFIEKDIERDSVAAKEVKQKAPGYGGIPVIDVSGTIIMGFNEGKMVDALKKLDKSKRGIL